jgi:acyl carrier protein
MNPATLPLAPAPVTPLPVSSGQRRLWFLTQVDPASPVYNIPYLLRLRGSLQCEALERALLTLVQRHEALRTTFISVDAEPMQVVHAAETVSLPLPVVDLADIPTGEREAELGRRATDVAKRPFDLEHDLPLRVQLFALADADHALLLVFHHIASDGQSMVIFYRELGACYEAFANGAQPVLPELPVQFADFAAWQRDYLVADVRRKLADYWTKQMAAAPALLELNLDFPRPAMSSHRGDTAVRRFPNELVLALRQLGRRNRVTLFMTLLAGLETVLVRHTGRTDIVLGTPSSGRDIAETDGTIGFFVNTLALRSDLSGDPTVAELLARIRDVTLTALEYRDLPYEILVEELQPRRDLSYDPVCQMLFALQHAMAPLQLPGISLDIAPVYTGTAKFDLTLWAIEQEDGGIEIVAEYATDLFEVETIKRLLGHFQTVLEGMAANPAARLSQLPLLTAVERAQLARWNKDQQAYVLDAHLQEVPVGVPGELWIGGDGVTSNHLRGAGVVTEKFIANPFLSSLPQDLLLAAGPNRASDSSSPVDPSRMFRTGARVKRQSDGALFLLDRLDHQAIDRATLTPPEIEGVNGAASACEADIERAITVIWKDVLALDHVGTDDNFFNLGGHSMQVLQVQDRLNATLGVDLPVLRLFEYSTIRSLARFISEQSRPVGVDPHDRLHGRTDERAKLRLNALQRRHAAAANETVVSRPRTRMGKSI